ncbi:probable pectate lyase 4 [Phtheirospermum japonicum]|uniref:Pectate lyase n=1 Tax=Phtheirospermum japonicum TaxID=374723 RepID=A0A830B9M0_9LAMI|nr:probable pectate lyase 4 [Phtheirospermum japonicum]
MGLQLPYGHVDCSLRGLAGQAEGFGRFAVGGLHGVVYCVTTLADDGPGSLRYGCRKKEPLWIVFEVSGTIELASHLTVSSHKTIDGRGQRIRLTGKGFRCHFAKHDKTMLVGGDASNTCDRCMRVTIHHCFFDGTRQRHPRVRFARVHLYNNYTRDWGIYAVCASVESQVYSQCNIYEAGHNKKMAFKYLTEKAADKAEECSGCVKSEGDLFVGKTQSGLVPLPSESCLFDPREYYEAWTVEAPNDDLKHFLKSCTGWQDINRPADASAS